MRRAPVAARIRDETGDEALNGSALALDIFSAFVLTVSWASSVDCSADNLFPRRSSTLIGCAVCASIRDLEEAAMRSLELSEQRRAELEAKAAAATSRLKEREAEVSARCHVTKC